MEGSATPVISIVAEYNPLHNGHRYLMEAARERLGDVPVVVVLSSNFTQRGEPALCDKWTRARMALVCGADVVLEVPFFFACAAAPDFSAAAVDILSRTRLATHIAFGMEDEEYHVEPLLDILLREPPSFKKLLQEEMKRGVSYPKAMAGALDACLPGAGAFASSPNNLLGLSYLLHIKKKDYPLSPLPIPRIGAGHNDQTLAPLASAGAIRAALSSGASLDDNGPLAEAMPDTSLSLLRGARDAGRLCLSSEKLWPLIQSLLLRSSRYDLRQFDGMDEGIENLFLKHWRDATGFDDFVGRCVSARYTQGHIRRRLIRLLLGVDRETARALRMVGILYARVLGFTERGQELLRATKKATTLPLITRLAAALGDLEWRLSQMEFRASALYELLLPCPDLHHEERTLPVIPDSGYR